MRYQPAPGIPHSCEPRNPSRSASRSTSSRPGKVAWRIHRGRRRRTPVSYTHLRAHETKANLVCRLLLEVGARKHSSASNVHVADVAVDTPSADGHSIARFAEHIAGDLLNEVADTLCGQGCDEERQRGSTSRTGHVRPSLPAEPLNAKPGWLLPTDAAVREVWPHHARPLKSTWPVAIHPIKPLSAAMF